MNDIIEALWLFLPAAIGNAAPVIANKIPRLNRWQTPLDFGRSYQGKRILGDNKTWRGITMGVVMASLTGLLQYNLSDHSQTALMWTLTGFLLGLGALYGDAVESFFKRQRGIASGKTWFPFDQTDYIVGGLIATAPLGLFNLIQIGAIIVVYFSLHLVATYLGYRLKLREQPI